jgi:hypothetical protein
VVSRALKEETDVAQYWNKMSDSGEAKKLGARTKNDRREDIENDQTVPQPKERVAVAAKEVLPSQVVQSPMTMVLPVRLSLIPQHYLSTFYLRNQEPKPEPNPRACRNIHADNGVQTRNPRRQIAKVSCDDKER